MARTSSHEHDSPEQVKDAVPSPQIQRRGGHATEQILQITLSLCEKIGPDALTVEGIAACAGVAKTTIYRRWPNVWAVVTDAVLYEVSKAVPISECSTARETFAASTKLLVKFYASERGHLLRMLIGRAQMDLELSEAIKTRWVEPRREQAREVVQRGMDRGEIQTGLNPDVVLDLLYGPIYHRLLVPYRNAKLDLSFVEEVLDIVFRSIRK